MNEPLMRLRGLIRKESLQILRDPSSIAIAFILPALLLLLFGYGVSLDARHVRLGLVVDAPSVAASSFTASFRQSPYFNPRDFANEPAAAQALAQRQIDGFLWLRSDFARKLSTGQSPPIGLYVNGIDANNARLIENYVQQSWAGWVARQAALAGVANPTPIAVEPRIWFNPAVRSRDYLVPGLIAVIMTLTGALLTALVVAREWERGTMEALMVTKVSMHEILASKIVPYFLLGMGGMVVSVLIAVFLFGVPLLGSLIVLGLASALFMLASLGMGLLISNVAKNQFVAGQIAIITTFLPAFILSGFIFDISSMPLPIRIITHIVAARYFVAILQTLFLAGTVWSVLLPNLAALLIMAVLFLGAARLTAHKRLD
ncbi:ABC transporter permease [Acidocella aminolytica]|uniref:ABC transporter n=1 Tax=Acidocella aminolytica 101 = DSM 11237 TaxID=1120923 RepID=A0A0D6PE95_9PROT|nr:ABC transporter permease [Acidocella aminolytica]GAN79169.1 ABC transporter [Acidocella aminolytica 101 = DSM 11237]GBQ43625.1 multidrug ABC transporter permease [Acidocella aminolytica 101 = DSM 11237]SHE67388.1 ABC-2 type transport system permease protein [Acidocella aminolytica 101 = DSM 11237]